MKVILMVICLVVLSSVSGQLRERPVILCGRQLANARVLLCYGAEYVIKRGNENLLLENLSENNYKGGDVDSPWTGRQGALSAGWSRYKRDEPGLVDQCCLRPCTKEVILNYC